MDNNNQNLGDKVVSDIQKDFTIVGKTRVHSWYAWAIVGIVFGMAMAIVYVANRSGQFSASHAEEPGLPIGAVDPNTGIGMEQPLKIEGVTSAQMIDNYNQKYGLGTVMSAPATAVIEADGTRALNFPSPKIYPINSKNLQSVKDIISQSVQMLPKMIELTLADANGANQVNTLIIGPRVPITDSGPWVNPLPGTTGTIGGTPDPNPQECKCEFTKYVLSCTGDPESSYAGDTGFLKKSAGGAVTYKGENYDPVSDPDSATQFSDSTTDAAGGSVPVLYSKKYQGCAGNDKCTQRCVANFHPDVPKPASKLWTCTANVVADSSTSKCQPAPVAAPK